MRPAILLYGILGAAAILFVVAFVLGLESDPFTIERDTTIAAPPDRVYAELEDLKRWEAWFPWLRAGSKDTKRTYKGAAKGVGAICEWEDDTHGANRLTITAADPAKTVTTRLDFTQARSRQFTLKLTLEPAGPNTKTRITLTGTDTVASKLFDRFKSYIVKDLDQSLTALTKASKTP